MKLEESTKASKDKDPPKRPAGRACGRFLAEKWEAIKKSLTADHKIAKAAELKSTPIMNGGARLDDTAASKTNDRNRASPFNLPSWLQGGGCVNERHGHQTRYGQGREGRARGRGSAGDDDHLYRHSPQYCDSCWKHVSEPILTDKVKTARGMR